MTSSEFVSSANASGAAAALLADVLRAFLFWNTGSLYTFREEDGLFAYHGAASAGERFCEKMAAMGVLVGAGRRGYRVTIRYDAIEAYASFLVQAGLDIDEIASAFAILLVDGVLDLLPNGKEPFDAKFYQRKDGTVSFDTRAMVAHLVDLGYANRSGEKYLWSAKMHRVIARAWGDSSFA